VLFRACSSLMHADKRLTCSSFHGAARTGSQAIVLGDWLSTEPGPAPSILPDPKASPL
jgi:hypothetical protein